MPLDPAALDDAVERAAVAVAADAVGAARWLLDASVAYAKERIQFGKPIGSFQAIQHKLVDAALVYEEAAAAVAHAAMCIDADDADRHRAVHVAKALAGSGARRVGRDACRSTAASATRGSTTCTCACAGPSPTTPWCGTHEWHLDRLADLLMGPPDRSSHRPGSLTVRTDMGVRYARPVRVMIRSTMEPTTGG